MRLRLGNASDGSESVLVFDKDSETWVPLVDATGASWEYGEGARRTVLGFLALGRKPRKGIAASVAAAAGAYGTKAPGERLPLRAASLRDAALYPRHVAQATAGFAPVANNNGHAIQMALRQLMARRLRLPTHKPSVDGRPDFYVGNASTIVGDGAECRWPSYAGYLDYELEIAFINGAEIGTEPSFEDIEPLIFDHGAFVMINDFTARDVQAEEMASGGFGFVKSKNFCTAMGSIVVTADDATMGAQLWQPGDMGSLFCGEGLKCSVEINGDAKGDAKYGGTMSTSGFRCCLLGDYVKTVALGEGLRPGEVLGLGTVPGCAGVETGDWLRPGDAIALSCECFGTLASTIGTPREGPDYKDLGVECEERGGRLRPSRLASAFSFFWHAVLGPPFVALLMVFGVVSSLVWPGPPPPPGLVGVEKVPARAKAADFSMWPGSDNSHVAPTVYEGGFQDAAQHEGILGHDYHAKKTA